MEALAVGAVGECADRAAVYLDAEDNAGDGDTAAGGGLQVFGTEEEDTGGLCLGGSGVGSLTDAVGQVYGAVLVEQAQGGVALAHDGDAGAVTPVGGVEVQTGGEGVFRANDLAQQ